MRRAVSGARGGNTIFNGKLRVTAKRGAEGLRLLTTRGPLLTGTGLSAILVEDPYGPWGGHYEEPASLNLNCVIERWKIVDHEVLAKGPLRATLWCRLAGRRSHLDLHVHLERGNSHVLVEARLLFLEEKARLKLRLPGCSRADFQVPGGVITRSPQGEVPGGRWVRARDARDRARFLFASDALYGFNLDRGALHATVARSSRFTLDVEEPAARLPRGEPVIDRGEFRFRFLLGVADLTAVAAADFLEEPPLVATLPARA